MIRSLIMKSSISSCAAVSVSVPFVEVSRSCSARICSASSSRSRMTSAVDGLSSGADLCVQRSAISAAR
jgi:hypothetical protein